MLLLAASIRQGVDKHTIKVCSAKQNIVEFNALSYESKLFGRVCVLPEIH